jgi:hypothetical protein
MSIADDEYLGVEYLGVPANSPGVFFLEAPHAAQLLRTS